MLSYKRFYENIYTNVSLAMGLVKKVLPLYYQFVKLEPFVEKLSMFLTEKNISRFESLVVEANRLLNSPVIVRVEKLLDVLSDFSSEAKNVLQVMSEARVLLSEVQPIVEKLRELNVSRVREAVVLLAKLSRVMPPEKLENLLQLAKNARRVNTMIKEGINRLRIVIVVSAASATASAVVLVVSLKRAMPGVSR